MSLWRSDIFITRAPLITCISIALIAGCSTIERRDAREVMLASAKHDDALFPDGINEKLVQFAFIGTVATTSGALKVIACRSVLTGMPAPRGKAWLAFFNTRDVFVQRVSVNPLIMPLGCHGSRVIFLGNQSDGNTTGNALELKDGLSHRHFVEQPHLGQKHSRSGLTRRGFRLLEISLDRDTEI